MFLQLERERERETGADSSNLPKEDEEERENALGMPPARETTKKRERLSEGVRLQRERGRERETQFLLPQE